MKVNHRAISAGASIFLILMAVIFAVIFGTGNFVPDALSERLIEETDVQYADAVESKKIIFQQALISGNIPDDTTEILKENGVLVGYLDSQNNFVENNKSGRDSVLKINSTIITSSNFISEVSSNAYLYDAFTKATYDRAAYYYDESAQKVFNQIGTSRNNYSSSSDFNSIIESSVNTNTNYNINSASKIQTEETTTYEVIGSNATTQNSSAQSLIESVASKFTASSSNEATLAAADTLKVADSTTQQQKSESFYTIIMEAISKMKAGEGNESKTNELMNFLTDSTTSTIVDVKTGQTTTVTGTPLEAPSLYAMLTHSTVSSDEVRNFSSDRILETTKNQLNLSTASLTTTNNLTSSVISNTLASTTNNLSGSIGRLLGSGIETVITTTLSPLIPTVSSSLFRTSIENYSGIVGGQLLAAGAINTGAELAEASGSSLGDAQAVISYQKLNSSILAMDAAADRIGRSPLDITSKNTFLGSIAYKLAISITTSSTLSSISSFSKVLSSSIGSLLPATFADEISSTYLSSYGDCLTYSTIGAVGSSECLRNETFDTSTLNDPYHNQDFINFIDTNTTLNSDGSRTINQNSTLAQYLIYHCEKTTPDGTIDGSILNSVQNSNPSTAQIASIANLAELYNNSSETAKRIATGAAFVNSSSNTDWQTQYRWAQRYISLARAASSLKQYSNDATAYHTVPYFEGENNPVLAFLDNYYSTSSTIASY